MNKEDEILLEWIKTLLLHSPSNAELKNKAINLINKITLENKNSKYIIQKLICNSNFEDANWELVKKEALDFIIGE